MWALAPSPDGQTVYLGGSFTSAGGHAHRRLAVLDATGVTTGSLALTPDERYLVVADAASSDVAILRTDVTDAAPSGPSPTSRTALVTTVPVGARPVDVVVPDWPWKE